VSLPELHETLLPVHATPLQEDLEIDEMWSFVGNKGNARWLWTVLCRRTRQVVAYAIGKRDIATGQKLWRTVCDLPDDLARYRFGSVFTDAHAIYDSVIPKAKHWPSDEDGGQGGTNHLERFHLTLRQRLARLTRKTLAFSKSDEMHEINLRLFFHRYNLERKAIYLRKTHHQHE
jgi:IS1 family transposase